MSQDHILFQVRNHHGADGGTPPSITDAVPADGPHVYRGYFENSDGEQWIFLYDYAADEATVRSGNAGWARVYKVNRGRVPGLTMRQAEEAWVAACFMESAFQAGKDKR